MDKQSREELLLGRLMEDIGLEKPSSAFSANVLKAITAKKANKEYKPLITKKVWVGVGFLFLLSIGSLYFMTLDQTLVIDLNFDPGYYLNFPQVEFSRTMIYAIGFVSLFFLQIPFLKNLIEKQFRY